MIYGPPRIYPIFGPTGPKMGKISPKESYLNQEKTLFS